MRPSPSVGRPLVSCFHVVAAVGRLVERRCPARTTAGRCSTADDACSTARRRRSRGFVGSKSTSIAPMSSFLKSTFCQVAPPSRERIDAAIGVRRRRRGRARRRRRRRDSADRPRRGRSAACRRGRCASTSCPRRWTCTSRCRTESDRACRPRRCRRRRSLDSMARRRWRRSTRAGAVEDRIPRASGVGRLPDAAADRAEIEGVRLTRHAATPLTRPPRNGPIMRQCSEEKSEVSIGDAP